RLVPSDVVEVLVAPGRRGDRRAGGSSLNSPRGPGLPRSLNQARVADRARARRELPAVEGLDAKCAAAAGAGLLAGPAVVRGRVPEAGQWHDVRRPRARGVRVRVDQRIAPVAPAPPGGPDARDPVPDPN